MPSISSAITIEGADSRYAIDGVDTYQIFFVETSGNLTVNRLTLTRGTTAIAGGAIQSNGSLSVNNTVFTNNYASRDGGAIAGHGSISNSTFIGNSAFYYGGAFIDGGTGGIQHSDTNISDSVFSNNTAGIGGGAIEVRSVLNVSSSAFLDNSANTEGGAISNASRGDNEGIGTLSVTNSTFSGNSAGRGSAIATGIHGVGPDIGNAVATLTHITVSGNTSGSAIYNEDTLNIYNSIIYGNSPSDCAGSLDANTRNIIGTGSCSTAYSSADPLLGSLLSRVNYFPLQAGSPAIDAADASQLPFTGPERHTSSARRGL